MPSPTGRDWPLHRYFHSPACPDVAPTATSWVSSDTGRGPTPTGGASAHRWVKNHRLYTLSPNPPPSRRRGPSPSGGGRWAGHIGSTRERSDQARRGGSNGSPTHASSLWSDPAQRCPTPECEKKGRGRESLAGRKGVTRRPDVPTLRDGIFASLRLHCFHQSPVQIPLHPSG
jgi:hypothetical protein